MTVEFINNSHWNPDMTIFDLIFHFIFRTSQEKPTRWPKIFVVMRMYWKNLPMEYYDFRSKNWVTLCDVQNWRSCTSMVAHGTCIYFIGE